MRILLTISYNGKNYVGWQKQKNGKSVQETIENALSFLLGQNIEICGSGRTDAKVHALAQTASFDATSERFVKNFCNKNSLNSKKLVAALNANLPFDIKVTGAKKVSPSFHARFNVKQKTYLYRLSWEETPFNQGYVGIVKEKPDVKEIENAARFLIGEHDFSSFCSAKAKTKDFVRTIFKIRLTKKHNELDFEICGNGFLYNMVRIIMGTLINIGLSRNQVSDMEKIIEAKDRTKAGKTVKSCGLYLLSVDYGEKF